MNSRCWIALCFGLTCSVLNAQSNVESKNGIVRAVEIPALTQDEIVVVPFDEEVYSASKGDFTNFVVKNKAGDQIAFDIRDRIEVSQRRVIHSWEVAPDAFVKNDDGSFEVTVRLRAPDPIPKKLQIVTPLKNFEQSVQVFTKEGSEKKLLVEDGLIFDYESHVDLRRDFVLLPETNAKVLVIRFGKLTSVQESQVSELTRSIRGGDEFTIERTMINKEPFRIDQFLLSAEVSAGEMSKNLRRPWTCLNLSVKQDTKEKATILEFDANYVPLTQVTLDFLERNFSRRVLLQGFDEHRGEWQTVHTDFISRFSFREKLEESLTLSFAASRSPRYRLWIYNRDNPRLQLLDAKLEGSEHELVFLGEVGKEYQLGIGVGKKLQIDDSTLRKALQLNPAPVLGKLGHSVTLAVEPEESFTPERHWFNNPFIIGTIAVVLIFFVAWLLFRAAQRIRYEAD